jgi:glycosyltransferase involved in cell wall biosynthesis
VINLHVFPDYLVHASRVRRMTATIAGSGLYSKVILVGRTGEGLRPTEDLDSTRTIVRIGGPTWRHPIARTLQFLGWNMAAAYRFRNAPVRSVNCHSLSALPACVALKWRHRANLIYEPHELETETSRMRGAIKHLARWAERFMLRFVDHVIVVSPSIENWYRTRQGVSRCTTVPNCPPYVDPHGADELRQTFGIAANIPVFLYQGILNHGRGIELLCEAFRGCGSEAALVLLGYGPMAPSQTRSEGNTHWHPGVPSDQLLRLTMSADFGLSLIEPISKSYEYCLPTKLFDYIMARKPVLVSNTLEQARLVEEFNLGAVVTQLTAESIRSAVLELARGDSQSFTPGLERASRQYSWERFEPLILAMHLRPREQPGVLARER